MPHYKVIAWAPNGKRASSKTYSTVVGLRDGLCAISDSRYYTVGIEVLESGWGPAIYEIVQAYTDGDYAPMTGPCKRSWNYATEPNGTRWRVNRVGSVSVTDDTSWLDFMPQWTACTP